MPVKKKPAAKFRCVPDFTADFYPSGMTGKYAVYRLIQAINTVLQTVTVIRNFMFHFDEVSHL